jgi:hypothetical protein
MEEDTVDWTSVSDLGSKELVNIQRWLGLLGSEYKTKEDLGDSY